MLVTLTDILRGGERPGRRHFSSRPTVRFRCADGAGFAEWRDHHATRDRPIPIGVEIFVDVEIGWVFSLDEDLWIADGAAAGMRDLGDTVELSGSLFGGDEGSGYRVALGHHTFDFNVDDHTRELLDTGPLPDGVRLQTDQLALLRGY